MQKEPTQSDSRELRVFISSTFRDFQEERKRLLENVYPEVRAKARERDVELTLVDLRWGLTDEQAQLGGAVITCLHEVDNSRPHFIGMLGERYGWCPDAGQWRPDASEPTLSTQVQQWIQQHESVTAMEILHGVLECPQERPYAYFYLRDSALTQQLQADDPEYAQAYVDLDVAGQRQQQLRERIRQGAPEGEKAWHARDYADLQAFEDQVKADLLSDLDTRFPEDEQPSELARLTRPHLIYARDRLKAYVEPTAFLDAAYSDLSNHRRLLLTGPSGRGKSSAVAALVQRFRDKHPNGLVIEHYPGAAPGSSPVSILLRALQMIRDHLGVDDELPSDEQGMIDAFPQWLARLAHKGIDTLFALDALNQLDLAEQSGTPMSWLPDSNLPHIHLLVSGQPDPATQALVQRQWSTQDVPELDPEQRERLIEGFLARHRKQLTDPQEKHLASAEAGANPLYLKVLLEELVRYGELSDGGSQNAHMDRAIDRYLACKDIPSLYEKMLERLETNHGSEVVSRFLGLLGASRGGLSEAELMHIAQVPPLTQAQLRYALDFNLANRDGLYGFAHQALEEAVITRYAVGAEHHRQIADYFEQQLKKLQTFDVRHAYELPWQLQQAGEWERLKKVLAIASMLEYYNKDVNHHRHYEYVGYWNSSKASGDDMYHEFRYQNESGTLLSALLQASKMNNAAVFLERIGHYDYAYKLGEDALLLYKEIIGVKNQDTARLHNNMGLICESSGKLYEALSHYNEAISIYKEIDKDDPSLYHNLAMLLQSLNELDASEQIHREAVSICKKKYGEKDVNTAESYNYLATTLLMRSNIDEAESYLRKAVTIIENYRILNPNTAAIYANLGVLHYQKKEFQEAISYINKSLTIRKNNCVNLDPQIANDYDNLAMALQMQGRLDEAVDAHRCAISIRERMHEERHHTIATSFHNLALTLVMKKNHEEAEHLLRHAVSIRIRKLPRHHSYTLDSQYELAKLLFVKKNYDESFDFFTKILSSKNIEDKCFITKLFTCHFSVGTILYTKEVYSDAIMHFQKAIDIARNSSNKNPLDVATIQNNIATCHFKLGNLEESEQYYLSALSGYLKTLPANHPLIISTEDNLTMINYARLT